jgi:hypothetical protein
MKTMPLVWMSKENDRKKMSWDRMILERQSSRKFLFFLFLFFLLLLLLLFTAVEDDILNAWHRITNCRWDRTITSAILFCCIWKMWSHHDIDRESLRFIRSRFIIVRKYSKKKKNTKKKEKYYQPLWGGEKREKNREREGDG